MKMYANASSFEANLTLQTRNTIRDASFSSYLNKSEENMIRKLANDHQYRPKSEDDEEIGVFGAEKYFKGEIEDGGNNNNNLRFIDTIDTTRKMHQKNETVEEFDHDFHEKLRVDQTNIHTPSVRSNASCNSRSGLLLHRSKKSPEKLENGSKTMTKTRTFLASFGCNCMNKKSTQVNDKRFVFAKQNSNTRTFEFDPKKTDQFSSKFEDTKTRNEYFSFPVLNSNNSNEQNSNSKSGNLAGKTVKLGDNNGRLSLGKKLSLLNDWEDEMYNSSSRRYNNEVESDSSSDLFEIESFSPTGEGSYLGQESNCYAPSEVSIEWSVVTASAADFSVVSDYEDVRTGGGGRRNFDGNAEVRDNKDEKKKRPGILSGCASHKAVRVAGDGYKVGGGEEGGRWRLSESTAVGSMFRGGII